MKTVLIFIIVMASLEILGSIVNILKTDEATLRGWHEKIQVELVAKGCGGEFTGGRVEIPSKYENQPIKIYIEKVK